MVIITVLFTFNVILVYYTIIYNSMNNILFIIANNNLLCKYIN